MESSTSDSDSLKDWQVVDHGQPPTEDSSECDSIEVLPEQHTDESSLDQTIEDLEPSEPETGPVDTPSSEKEDNVHSIEAKTLVPCPPQGMANSWDFVNSRQTLFETVAILISATILFASLYQSSSVPSNYMESNIMKTLADIPGHHLPPDGAVMDELYTYEELSNALKLKLKNTDKMINALKDYMNKDPSQLPDEAQVPPSTPKPPLEGSKEEPSKPTSVPNRKGNFGLLINFMIFVRDSGLFNEIGESASHDLTTFEKILDLSTTNPKGGNWDRTLFRFLENQGSTLHRTLSSLNRNLLDGMSEMMSLFYNEYCVKGSAGKVMPLCKELADKGVHMNNGKKVFSQDSIQKSHYDNVVRSQNEFKLRRLMEVEPTPKDETVESAGECESGWDCVNEGGKETKGGEKYESQYTRQSDFKDSQSHQGFDKNYQKHGKKHEGKEKYNEYKKQEDSGKRRDDYKKNKEFMKHDQFQKHGGYEGQGDYKKHDEYKKHDDYKTTDEYKKRDDYMKQDNYKTTDEYKKRDDYKKHDDYNKNDDYKSRENGKPEEYKKRGNYKTPDEHIKHGDYNKHEKYSKQDDFKKQEKQKKYDEEKKHNDYYKRDEYKKREDYKRPPDHHKEHFKEYERPYGNAPRSEVSAEGTHTQTSGGDQIEGKTKCGKQLKEMKKTNDDPSGYWFFKLGEGRAVERERGSWRRWTSKKAVLPYSWYLRKLKKRDKWRESVL